MSEIRGTGSNEITQTVSQPVSTNQSAVISTNDQAALQAQIAALTAQVASLQASMNSLTHNDETGLFDVELPHPDPVGGTTIPHPDPVGGIIVPHPDPVAGTPPPTARELRDFVKDARRENVQELRATRRELRTLLRDDTLDAQQTQQIAALRAEIAQRESARVFWREQRSVDFNEVNDPSALQSAYTGLRQAFGANDGTANANIVQLKAQVTIATYRNPLETASTLGQPRPIDPREELAFSDFKTEFYEAQRQNLRDLRSTYSGVNDSTGTAQTQVQNINDQIVTTRRASSFWATEENFWQGATERLSNGPQNLHGYSEAQISESMRGQTALENLADQQITVGNSPEQQAVATSTQRLAANNRAVVNLWIGAAQFDARFATSSGTQSGQLQARADLFSRTTAGTATTLLNEIQQMTINLTALVSREGVGAQGAAALRRDIAAKRAEVTRLAS